MGRLEDVSTDALWEILDDVDESVPTQRIVAAIAAKQGDSTSRLAARHNVSQQTIRNWLSRFENQPVTEAPFDDPRPGRPRKLSDAAHAQLIDDLHDAPGASGYDHRAWVPRLVSHHLQTEYGVEYSLRHIRRLMREAGVTWQTAGRTPSEGDTEQAAEHQEEGKIPDSP